MINRYARVGTLRAGKMQATSMQMSRLHQLVKSGAIATINLVIKEGVRLDHIAGKRYGDGRLWWVIAAASGVGWNLQCPPGTRLVIPTSLQQIDALVG